MWTIISDLHLFSHRSRAHKHMPKVVETARRSEALFLNGDIFDFKWSRIGDVEATMNAAEQWLRELHQSCPRCQIYYVLGNHDAAQVWAERCIDLAQELDRFRWSPDYLRVGDTLFNHGDLLLGAEPQIKRRLQPVVRPKGATLGRAYDVAARLRVTRLAALSYSPQRCARMLHRNFLKLDADLTEGVRRLCTGHTHQPFSNLRVGELELHNTGSTIAGMPFLPLLLPSAADSGVKS